MTEKEIAERVVTRGEELADDHVVQFSEIMEPLLSKFYANGYNEMTRSLMHRFFVHGYKHGLEEQAEDQREVSDEEK